MKKNEELWVYFAQEWSLSEKSLERFKRYYQLLISYNELFNLTTVTTIKEVIEYHFSDSLILGKFIDLSQKRMLADAGSGAGFPGIPLAILYPELPILLIEVTKKKILFLEEVISELKLENCQVYPLDWRTFLRKTSYPVDIITARASLLIPELLRMFRQNCPYSNAQLVYWASYAWQVDPVYANYYVREEEYKVGNKKRKLVVFQDKKLKKEPIKTA